MFDDDDSVFVPARGSNDAEPKHTASDYGSPISVGAASPDESTFVGAMPRPAVTEPSAAGATPVPAGSDDESSFVGGVPRPAVTEPSAAGATPVPAGADDESSFVGGVPRPAVTASAAAGATPVPAGADDESSFVGAMPRPAVTEPSAAALLGAGGTEQARSAQPAADQKKVPEMPSLSPFGLSAAQNVAEGSSPLLPLSVELKHRRVAADRIGRAETDYLPDGTLLNNGMYRIILVDDPENPGEKKPLGRGGFGITYLAVDTHLNRKVVIKENFPRGLAVRLRNLKVLFVEPNLRELFSKEAKVIASVKERHPNIVDVNIFFYDYDTSYYVMPYVDGVSLYSLIETQTWEEASVRELLQGLLSGLSYLHELGIYHLDIKPHNVLMHKQKVPVLIDFGASRSSVLPNDDLVVSEGYAPPEQCSYETSNLLGAWSDLYSLGATMYHVITGARPRSGIKPLLEQASSYPRYSRAFLASVDKAMHPEIKHRWQSAREWLEMFSRMDEITRDAKRLI